MFDSSSQKGPEETLRLAIPSDGEMYESTLGFLSECGMSVSRGNFRHYMGQLSSLSDVVVLFQRAADITSKVEEGSADIGIVGLDRFAESKLDDGESLTIIDDLSYSRCKLVTAVPQGWLDVSEMADLADLAAEFRERGRDLRVATKYPRSTQRFFFSRGIYYFTLVQSSGSLEAAPSHGLCRRHCGYIRHRHHAEGKSAQDPGGRDGHGIPGVPHRKQDVSERQRGEEGADAPLH